MVQAKPKILLVDDNPINVRVAAKILHTHNYNISFSKSGVEAIQKASQIDFDLILLDIMMPGMDGYEVCEILKKNPNTSHIPIIFLTAKTEAEDVVHAFELGGADYLTKPFNAMELLSRVQTHVRLKRSLEAFEVANKQLRESSNTKDKMFSIISHDLLGPLGNIKESLELIVNKEVEMDKQAMEKFIKATWNAVGNAFNLLENLLYWARNQRGKMVYNPKTLDLNQIVTETHSLLEGVAKNKNITLINNLSGENRVYGDKNAIKTILRNLVSNAIKFTQPQGSVSICLNDSDPLFMQLAVCDNGVGMDEQSANSLFSANRKNSPKWGTNGEKGVGLGLIISKEFVEKHGGKIWLESAEGKGSTFYFTLPKYAKQYGYTSK